MEFTVSERIALLGILPKEGNFRTLKVVRQLREALSFDDEENKLLNFRQEGQMVRWEKEAVGVKEVEIGERMEDLITDTLNKLNKTEKLRDEHFTLCEKFNIGGN